MHYFKNKMISYNSQFVDSDDISFVSSVLKSPQITQGPMVDLFEKKISNFVKSKYCKVTNSGTAALYLAIKSLQLKKNSTVVMPSVNFIAAYNMCKILNFKIYLADINPISGCMEPKNFYDCIKKNKINKIDLILNMHMGGNPNYVLEYSKIKKKYNSYLIEDSCHALGSAYKFKQKNYKVGCCAHSDISTFSFHAIKSITTGEGGAITTNSKNFDKRILNMRSHGILRSKKHWKYDVLFPSFNLRLSDINCALGISQLKKINLFIKKRNFIASRYFLKLSSLRNFISLQKIEKYYLSSFHLFQISIDFDKLKTTKDKFFEFMKKKKIFLQYHYTPIYKFSLFKKKITLPGAETHYKNNISIPIHYNMKIKEIDYVISVISEFILKNKSSKFFKI